ncbi:hypothetical protein CCACVL1_26385, partial [Corchorus capsularis]
PSFSGDPNKLELMLMQFSIKRFMESWPHRLLAMARGQGPGAMHSQAQPPV